MNADRYRWTIKPPLGYGVDVGHELAQGLRAYWLFNGIGQNILRDLNRGFDVTQVTPGTWTGTKYGPGLKLNGTSQYAELVKVLIPSGDFTISALITPAAVSAAGYVFVQGASTGSKIFMGTTTGALWTYDTGGTNFNGTITAVAGTTVRLTMTYAAGRTNKTQPFVNAKADATDTGAAVYTGDRIRIGQGTGGGSFFNGTIIDVIAWRRALSQAEIAWLVEEPWAMILPPPTRQWFVPVAAAAAFFRKPPGQPAGKRPVMTFRRQGL